MVKTPPYQKRGKCGHFMPQFDSHLTCFGCRTKRKGQDPCAKGAKIDQCAACSTLTKEQWIHLRECFSKRSSYRQRSSSQDENLEPETDEEPVFTGEDLGQVDDTLLDLEPEQTGKILHRSPALVLSITSFHLLLYRLVSAILHRSPALVLSITSLHLLLYR